MGAAPALRSSRRYDEASVLEAFVLAVGLAMDATAVAAARGASGIRRAEALRLAISFGSFQAGMAALGWWIGATAARWVASWDHWLAFALLSLIGGKMLVEAFRRRPEEPAGNRPPLTTRTLLVLSVATSIDALAAGATLPLMDVPVAASVAVIGAATLLFSLAGALGGGALGARAGAKLEVAGGLALIAIGFKILLEHLNTN
jgi:manganese efflux pump family protein